MSFVSMQLIGHIRRYYSRIRPIRIDPKRLGISSGMRGIAQEVMRDKDSNPEHAINDMGV